MDFTFTGAVVEWRGPAPFYFLEVPVDVSDDIKEAARGLEYWGQVAVEVRVGDTRFTTALFPKDGRYLVPLKVAVRTAAGIELGQELTVGLQVAGLSGRDAP
ncbi:DUF1905 domain-containing protein [Nocardioides caeni]|uniref:DUF1905 domain-containing protein n=1 Tax=Nocardioides caeni TaxID=574700 RepID=A0A4S8N5M9_9ACTN|nr:DUF1905 domain-containing protein [Nocardioides caeni]THV10054.1 DUF1905 domain-containing protein [Nocardioides caeni]